MTMNHFDTKPVRLPIFDGNHKNFQVWWMHFWAYAVVYKFVQALVPGGETTMPASEATTLDVTVPAEKVSNEA